MIIALYTNLFFSRGAVYYLGEVTKLRLPRFQGEKMSKESKEMLAKFRNKEVPITIIKEIKQVTGLSNTDIATLIGLSFVQIYDIEKGKYNPHLTTREKLYKLHKKVTLHAVQQ